MNTPAADVSRRNLVIVVVSTVVGLVGGVYLSRPVIAQWIDPRAHAPLPLSTLQEGAREANAGCPKMIDSETELRSTTAAEGMFIYNYRLVSSLKEQLDVTAFEAAVRPKIIAGVCAEPATRQGLLNHQVTMRYVYADKDGAVISSFDIGLKDCAAAASTMDN